MFQVLSDVVAEMNLSSERLGKKKEGKHMIDARILQGEENKLIGIIKDESYDALMRLLYFMKENVIPLSVNTEDIADVDCDEHFIDYISLVSPKVCGEIDPYIMVCVD